MFWDRHVLPILVEHVCTRPAITQAREAVVGRARGEVLELGIGTGLNLAHYDPRHVRRITGIDPAPALLARAAPRVRRATIPVELVTADAEALPFAAASFDSAVVTYTLCSIADPVRALAEVARVLRPGGALHFIEHGLAPGAIMRGVQRAMTPMWRRLGGGCRLDRDVPGMFRRAGFRLDELAAAYAPGPVPAMSFTFRGIAARE